VEYLAGIGPGSGYKELEFALPDEIGLDLWKVPTKR
jgi:hypothetical protein